MLHAEEINKTCRCTEGLKSAVETIQTSIKNLQKRGEQLATEREEKERKKAEKMLESVAEHIGKNISMQIESMVQKEIRTCIAQKIEKVLTAKLEQKLQEVANACTAAIASAAESKALHSAVMRMIKTGIVDAVVPVIENGMNEIRIQVLEQAQKLPLHIERIEDEYASQESKEETLDNIVSQLRNEDYAEDECKEDACQRVMHLLETNIVECFAYVLDAEDASTFMFFLEKIPLDAEMDIPSTLLISFVYQLVPIIVNNDADNAQLRLKHILLLNVALSQVQKCRIDKKDAEILHKSVSQLYNNIHFGDTLEEKETLVLIDRISKK